MEDVPKPTFLWQKIGWPVNSSDIYSTEAHITAITSFGIDLILDPTSSTTFHVGWILGKLCAASFALVTLKTCVEYNDWVDAGVSCGRQGFARAMVNTRPFYYQGKFIYQRPPQAHHLDDVSIVLFVVVVGVALTGCVSSCSLSSSISTPVLSLLCLVSSPFISSHFVS